MYIWKSNTFNSNLHSHHIHKGQLNWNLKLLYNKQWRLYRISTYLFPFLSNHVTFTFCSLSDWYWFGPTILLVPIFLSYHLIYFLLLLPPLHSTFQVMANILPIPLSFPFILGVGLCSFISPCFVIICSKNRLKPMSLQHRLFSVVCFPWNECDNGCNVVSHLNAKFGQILYSLW